MVTNIIINLCRSKFYILGGKKMRLESVEFSFLLNDFYLGALQLANNLLISSQTNVWFGF